MFIFGEFWKAFYFKRAAIRDWDISMMFAFIAPRYSMPVQWCKTFIAMCDLRHIRRKFSVVLRHSFLHIFPLSPASWLGDETRPMSNANPRRKLSRPRWRHGWRNRDVRTFHSETGNPHLCQTHSAQSLLQEPLLKPQPRPDQASGVDEGAEPICPWMRGNTNSEVSVALFFRCKLADFVIYNWFR